MREWLTVIIVVLILGILLDGWRRMRNARRDTLKVSRSVYRPKPADKPQAPEQPERSPFSSELPNGGARVVGSRANTSDAGRREAYAGPKTAKRAAPAATPHKTRQSHNPTPDPDPLDPDWQDLELESEQQAESVRSANPAEDSIESAPYDNEDLETEYLEAAEQDAEAERVPVRRAKPEEETARIPQQVSLNLDESVPLLMESVEDDEQEAEPPRSSAATSRSQKGQPQKPSMPDFNIEGTEADDDRIEPTLGSDADLGSSDLDSSYIESADDDLEPVPTEAPKAKSKPIKAAPKPEPAPSFVEDEDPGEPEEVLIINVMARPGHYFQGEPLLQEIFDAGMRYGSMSIFHRYRDARGGGPVLFSLANMVKPGTFDLDAMNQFQTPGVSLFMTLPMSGDSLETFELMLDTAKGIAENLNGELKDENRSIMTKQTMEHDRQRVLEFERRQLSRAH